MASHRITVEFLGVPSEHTGLLDGFFSKIRSIIAEIWDLEMKPGDVFCFPRFTSDKQGSELHMFIRYGTTSSALLDLGWKRSVHLSIEKTVKEHFGAESVEFIE